MRSKFEICQTVAVIILTSQFHEFFESHFWRGFAIWPNCALSSYLNQPISRSPVSQTSFLLYNCLYKKKKLKKKLLLLLIRDE